MALVMNKPTKSMPKREIKMRIDGDEVMPPEQGGTLPASSGKPAPMPRHEFEAHVKVIKDGAKTFLDVVRSMTAIHDSKAWKQCTKFKTWDEFCRDSLGFSA